MRRHRELGLIVLTTVMHELLLLLHECILNHSLNLLLPNHLLCLLLDLLLLLVGKLVRWVLTLSAAILVGRLNNVKVNRILGSLLVERDLLAFRRVLGLLLRDRELYSSALPLLSFCASGFVRMLTFLLLRVLPFQARRSPFHGR